MNRESTILVMAGAREAHGIVSALLGRRRRVISSLPEAGRMFETLLVPTRVGPFSGETEFSDFVKQEGVTTVIDASHAFDTQESDLAAEVCDRVGIRYLRVLRPAWKPSHRDRWRRVRSVSEAVGKFPADARVFSNTGWPTLPEYADFKGQRLFMRQTDDAPREALFSFVTFVPGHPPFTQFQEQDLFTSLRITHLICRNTGGAASMSKLLAARELGLPVYMVERRASKHRRPVVETVAEALAWEAA